jgi:hypothetical protein
MELLLWAVIHSLDKGKGCWANNRFFADRLRITPRRVQQIIRVLMSSDIRIDPFATRAFDPLTSVSCPPRGLFSSDRSVASHAAGSFPHES